MWNIFGISIAVWMLLCGSFAISVTILQAIYVYIKEKLWTKKR